jgi:large repetitive protein
VTGFTPAAAPVGTVVTVNGTSLDSVTSATLNGQNVGTLTHVNATQLKFTVPGGASSGKIAVTDAAGTGTSAADFKVTPKVTGFSPGLGVRGSSVQIDGTTLTSATKVAFGAVASLSFTVDNDSTIHAVVPPTATTNKITVTTPSGVGTSAANFIVTLPPTVTGFSPGSGPVGTVVTVNGTSLDSVTSATLNGQNVGALTHVNATQLKLTVPAGASTGTIGVTDAAATGTSAVTFKVTPKVTGYNPAGGAAAGAAVTINGTSLTGATLKFNGVAAPVEGGSDDTHINTRVPATATTGAVSVTTPGGTATGPSFKVLPTITSLTPDNGPAGTSVTITGTTFVGVSSVKFNGLAAAASTLNATTIKATVPAGATTGPVTVTTPGGTATSPSPFTVGPKITSFSPASGPTGATVTINGNGFHGTPTVTFSGLASPSVTGVTPTSLKAVVPNGATTGQVQVTTGDGAGTSATNFSVTFSVTGFAPPSGAVGDAVTITGVGFLKVTGVKFGDVIANGSIDSDTQLSVTVPAGATSGPIVVSNGTTAVTSRVAFDVISLLVPQERIAFVRDSPSSAIYTMRRDLAGQPCGRARLEPKSLPAEERPHRLPQDAEVVAEQRRPG